MSVHAGFKRWAAIGSIGLALLLATQPITTLGQTATPIVTPTSSIDTPAPTIEATLTSEPIATDTLEPTSTLAPTYTPTPTSTPIPTDTPAPTSTHVPTKTPVPTNTSAPTLTPVPVATLMPPTVVAPASLGGVLNNLGPLPIIIGGAVLVLILLLWLISRSRRRPPAPTKPIAPLPPTAPATASLEFTTADGNVITFELDKPVMVLGRDSRCDIVLPASLANIDSVSHQHARFQRDEDGISVHDLETKNGLSVNGRHTNHNLLEDGDRLAFGSVEAAFHNKR